MNVAQSHNASHLSGMANKGNFNPNSSSRNFVNQTEHASNMQVGRNNAHVNRSTDANPKQHRTKISKPPKYDGSASRYGNMYTEHSNHHNS